MNQNMQETTEEGGAWPRNRWRAAAWVAAGLLLLLPLATGAPWTGSDFAVAAVLLFVPLSIYELVARRVSDPLYRAGAGVALVTALLLFWVSGAVGITDSAADGLYVLALAVGVVGAFGARFRPRGMAHAMVATALALASTGIVASGTEGVPAHNSAFEILGITGLFAALFVGSAVLFREAARRGPERRVV